LVLNNGSEVPLPADVVYNDLPTVLIYELGRTPEGQKIVHVGTDLLLKYWTGIVLDPIEN
jgi:hypothetical protein